MPVVHGTKNLSEKTGAQILAQPLAGGILYPSWNDELPLGYGAIWGDLADMPFLPNISLADAPANDAYGLGNNWQMFYARRALWYRAIRAMRRDPTINMARILSVAPMMAAGWSFEEREDAPEGAKDWIEAQIEPFRMHLLYTGMTGCYDFGWQSYEKISYYDEDDRKMAFRKFKPLLPDLTHIRVNQKNGDFIGLQQFQNFASIQENSVIDIPVQQSLLYYIDYEGTNWYGNSVMRVAEQPYRNWAITNAAATRYDMKIAGSHWVVHYPIGQSLYNGVETDNFVIAKGIIAQLESSGAVAIPTNLAPYLDDISLNANAEEKREWRVEILSDQSAGAQSFDTRLKYLDALKMRAFGLPERSAIEGKFGTKAEAGEHIDFALTHVETRHKFFCQFTNWHVINQMLRWNWGRKAENTVFCKPTPLSDEKIAFFRQLYLKLLELPSTEALETSSIDFDSLKDRLDIPLLDETLEGDLDTEAPEGDENNVDINDILSSMDFAKAN